MKTSQNGIDLIKRFEGCRLTAYRCPAGKPTIGYGHTAGVRMGQKITQAQADGFLRDDLAKFERAVMKYDHVYHWNQNQFDALVSFSFNLGSIDGLTAKGKRTVEEISAAILKYNTAKVNGVRKVLSGLTERRKAERALFLQPARKDMQAASTEPGDMGHVQMNYQPGKTYKIAVDGLRIRTKEARQDPISLPNAGIIGIAKRGAAVTNHATARVGDAIWMCIGPGNRSRERWICADNGEKAYVR